MAVSKVNKFHIFAHLSIKESLLEELQKLGCLQITSIEKSTDFHDWNGVEDSIENKTSAKLNKVKFCIDLLSSYGNERKKGLQSLISSKETINYDKLVEIAQQFDYESLFQQCTTLDNELNHLKLEENKLNTAKKEIQKWEDLELDFSEIDKTKYVKYILGSLKKNNFNNLVQDIERETKTNLIQIIKEEKDKLHIVIITLKENDAVISNFLQKYNFEIYRYSYPFTGTPKQILKTISEQLISISKRKGEISQVIIKLHRANQLIYPLYDFLLINQEKEEAKKYLKKSENALVIKGWIQKKDIPKLQNRLKEYFTTYEITFTDPEEDDQIPVVLDNHKLIKPFEFITELYSIPKYDEIDPTPVLSIFYFVFFGLCLSDVGYGAILAILSHLAITKLKLEGGSQKFFKLLHYCGIAGILGGIVVGSWFGDILDYLPPIFNNIRMFLMQKLALFHPADNPVPLLIVSLSLGVIQIYTGIILKFLDNVRKGKLFYGLMDQVSWLFLLTGIILILLKGTIAPIFDKVAWLMVGVGALTLVLTQGRAKKNVLLKIGSGLLSLYNISGYLSDVLSYSRLFALSLTTGIIAEIFNMFAMMVNDVPYVGIFLTIIILLIGHIFNLLISLLSAFVHDIRLQFIEFFSKFYEGGGIPFKPFSIRTIYTKVGENTK